MKESESETGQVLILVLILLLLGALIIAPLLSFMGASLKQGQLVETRMLELYAADTGIEDAIWKIMHIPPAELPTDPYYLAVNGKDVAVTLPSGMDEEIAFFINLGLLKDKQGTYNKATPHREWLLVYAPLEEEEGGMYSEYRITAFYTGGGQPHVLTTGFWIHNYGDTAVVQPWASGEDNYLEMDLNGDGKIGEINLNGIIINEANIETKSLIDDYPNYDFSIVDYFGNAFIWNWKAAKPINRPQFGKNQPICRTQRFLLSKSLPLSKFSVNVAWIGTQENCIQISWAGDITGMTGITSVATSPDIGKSTTVESLVFAQQLPEGLVAITILTWESSIQ